MKKTNKKGFTIIELVIVIAVIAILAAVLIPTFTSISNRAKESAALQEAKNAYTLACAEAMADGYINEVDDEDKDNEEIGYVGKPGIQIKSGDFTFTLINGVLKEVEVKEDSKYDDDYTFNVDTENGVIVSVTYND